MLSSYYKLEKKIVSDNHDLTAYEYGKCSICGYYSRFRYNEIINSSSQIAISCDYDNEFIKVINVTNSLHCRFCQSKFRVRAAAESLLNRIVRGKFNDIHALVDQMEKKGVNLNILETSSTDGIFSLYTGLINVIKSEYLDDVKRGEYKNELRSEDLQELTFKNDSLDVVIALDVFEHIADKMKAFSEVSRVLKDNGIAIITVPIDNRVEKTTTLASVVNGRIEFFRKPAYHSDPLRAEGALVFTEFGMDIINNLKALGYDATMDQYTTQKSNVTQFVLVIKK